MAECEADPGGQESGGATRRYHHGAIAEAALRQALAILRRDGADAVTMRAVAAAIGVAHRALYRHFPDRAALLDHLAAFGFNKLADEIRSAPERFVDGFVRFACDEPHLFALMQARIQQAPFDESQALRSAAGAVVESAATAFASAGQDDISRRDRVISGLAITLGVLALWRAGQLHVRTPERLAAYIHALAWAPEPSIQLAPCTACGAN